LSLIKLLPAAHGGSTADVARAPTVSASAGPMFYCRMRGTGVLT